jgi:type IV pilus assembly protein PilV
MLNRPSPRATPRFASRCQHGIALLESLVSIVILAIAVLGMLSVQLRTLADTQTGVRRAQGIRLIEDFAERIKTNPDGFRQLRNYVASWDAMPAAPDCEKSACDAATLAKWDIAVWKQSVADTLPMGRASVFESSDETRPGHGRQLGVMVAWRASERGTTDKGYTDSLALHPPGAGVDCPAGLACHLAHVQP